ncbi:LamG domain-containing protein [Kribbella sp. NPDC056951]|uniref:LamG domain-containing protein n=1 Tax=Kribbella sp. NPDC056951 TaxID=3345978 RepID=UPI0036288FA6
MPFDIASNGKIAWGKVPVNLSVPLSAPPGEYKLKFVATPTSGTATTTEWTIRVAQPSATAYPDLVKQDGATAYWRFGETSGTTFADSSPYNTVATARDQVQLGQPGAIAGDGNGSVRLNGGYVDTPHALAVTPSGPCTFEAWIKITSAYQQGILEKYTKPASNGFALRLVDRNVVQLELIGPNGVVSRITGRTTVQPGQWHHVAVAYDRSWMDIYVDGKLEFRTPAGGMPTVGDAPLRIGARGDDAAFRLNGWIDEVAMYGVPLTAAQIQAHYDRGALGAPLS